MSMKLKNLHIPEKSEYAIPPVPHDIINSITPI
jgi:hypothetical protein